LACSHLVQVYTMQMKHEPLLILLINTLCFLSKGMGMKCRISMNKIKIPINIANSLSSIKLKFIEATKHKSKNIILRTLNCPWNSNFSKQQNQNYYNKLQWPLWILWICAWILWNQKEITNSYLVTSWHVGTINIFMIDETYHWYLSLYVCKPK